MPVAVEDPYDTYRPKCSFEEHVGKTLKADKQVTFLEEKSSIFGTKQSQTLENLLPDEEDLLSGVLDDLGCTAAAHSNDEDFDQSSSDYSASSEHPSRTLLVKNVDTRVEDSDLRVLFEDNTSGQYIDQANLEVFSCDSSISNDKLHQVFDSFGEIEDICATMHHRYIKDEYIYGVHSLLQPSCYLTNSYPSLVGMSSTYNQFHHMPYYSTDQAFYPHSLPVSCKGFTTYDSLNLETADFTTETYDKHLHMLGPYGPPTGSPRMAKSALSEHHYALSWSNSFQNHYQNHVIWSKSNCPPFNNNVCAHTNSMKCSFKRPKGRARRIFHGRHGHVYCHTDDKKFELDIERVLRGEDSRTTLMIKNIPNKYSSAMLLAAINEHNEGTYDFVYLPLDFKNKCNMGYAFINMTDPLQIVPFHKSINGKKWEKFHSGKVACLAYARIQGKAALIANFQESSLMNEDKCCHPILFTTDGPNAGNQEPFPLGPNIHSRRHKNRYSTHKGNENQEISSTALKRSLIHHI